MSPTRLDLRFLPEAPILARLVLLPLEAIAVMLAILGPNEEGVCCSVLFLSLCPDDIHRYADDAQAHDDADAVIEMEAVE
jgi:hypothetical protein